jgi:hypothetical protein
MPRELPGRRLVEKLGAGRAVSDAFGPRGPSYPNTRAIVHPRREGGADAASSDHPAKLPAIGKHVPRPTPSHLPAPHSERRPASIPRRRRSAPVLAAIVAILVIYAIWSMRA